MTPGSLATRLFFIGGCGRSGTTLMKSMLAASPRVYVPPETFFFSGIRGRFLGTEVEITDDMVHYVSSRWWLRDAGLDEVDLRLQVAEMAPEMQHEFGAWPALFLSMMACLCPEGQWDAVGEKTPENILHAPELLDSFPQARFVQMVRDPRAVLASYRDVRVGPNEAAAVAAMWSKAVAVHDQLRQHPRAILVRYEDLVRDPQRTARRVSRHLGIDFESSMLKFHDRATRGYAVEQVHHSSTLRPIFQESIDSWRERLPQGQLRILETLVGGSMERFGYERSVRSTPVSPWRVRASHVREALHRSMVRRVRQRVKGLRATHRMR